MPVHANSQMNSNKRMELLIIQPLLVNDRFELTFSPFYF